MRPGSSSSPGSRGGTHRAWSRVSAQLKIINGAGHFTWKDAPDRYWPIITEFITSAPALLAQAVNA